MGFTNCLTAFAVASALFSFSASALDINSKTNLAVYWVCMAVQLRAIVSHDQGANLVLRVKVLGRNVSVISAKNHRLILFRLVSSTYSPSRLQEDILGATLGTSVMEMSTRLVM